MKPYSDILTIAVLMKLDCKICTKNKRNQYFKTLISESNEIDWKIFI